MAEKKEGKGAAIKNWFKGVKSELKKIVWPTGNKIIKDSVIVIVSVAIVSAFLSVINWVFHLVLEKLLG